MYESIANLVLFASLLLILRLYNKRPDKFPNGLVFATYLGVYAIYRSIIEYYRIDSSFVLGIKVVYILDIITIIAVLIIINYLVKKFREKKIREEIKKLEE